MINSSEWLAPIQVCRWIGNTIFYQALAVITIYSIWIPIVNFSQPFSWHVILSTLGLVPLMATALMLYGSDNVWSQNLERKTKNLMHGVLMAISGVLIIVGIALETNRTSGISTYTHFSTAHGMTGLVCMILLIFALILGLLTYFAKSLVGYVRPIILKFVHNVLGHLTFIIGIVSLCCGFYTRWFVFFTTEESRMTATVVTGILCAWSLIYAFIAAVKQAKNIVNK